MLYPDNWQIMEDKSILQNAKGFSTRARARRALETLNLELSYLDNEERALLAIEGFEDMAVSLEDLMGWLFVFRD